jgi:hypothetical protein
MESPVKVVEPEPPRRSKLTWQNALKLVAGIALVAFVVWVWPESPIDMTKVHPELRTLQFPLKQVEIGSYLDGGSVGMRLVDATGKKLEFNLPCTPPLGTLQALRFGSMEPSPERSTVVQSPKETERYLQRLADEHAPLNVNKVAALLSWRTAPRDCLRFVGWVLLNHFDDYGVWRATAPNDPMVKPPAPASQ